MVLVCAAALAASACSGSSSHAAPTASTIPPVAARPGVLVIGAEQWPKCLNPLNQCANSTWESWMAPLQVLPRLTELDAHGNQVASPLLKEMPSVQNGDITSNPFTVTFHLNPAARWEPDGTPITSADVAFTWHAMLDTKGSISTFHLIDRIDTPDAHTAQVVYKRSYPGWADLFGGFTGVVLEKAKFTSTDTSATMVDSIPFSGGPWMLESFSAQREVLVANTRYWDKERIPRIHEIDFVPTGSHANAEQMLHTGAISLLYPQPDTQLVNDLKPETKTRQTFGSSTAFENLWFNEKPDHPFADLNLRAAFSYAFDRQQFLDQIVKPFDPAAKLLNCAAWISGVGPWCDNTEFADVRADSGKVAQYMEAAGYAKDTKGIWTKAGHELVIHWMVNTDNTHRLATQQDFIPALAQQGFRVVADNSDAATMFETRLPQGDYDLAMFAQVTSADPSVATLFETAEIPSSANAGQGQNDTWYSNPQVNRLITEADSEIDVARRATLTHEIGAALRADYAVLPLYVPPTLVVWRTDRVAGPIDQYIDSPESVFANMYAWTQR